MELYRAGPAFGFDQTAREGEHGTGKATGATGKRLLQMWQNRGPEKEIQTLHQVPPLQTLFDSFYWRQSLAGYRFQ